MSHYPHLNRDSSCKCKYCSTQDHMKQQRIDHQQRAHNYQHQVHGHLSGGGGGPPVAGRVAPCGRARGTSPSRYPKVEQQQNCCKGIKCSAVEDPVECHKMRFQELRKTWSEFARVCNCPNCKGSLQKEHYLDKLAESADRAASYHHSEEDCCCSASSIPSANTHNHHKSQRPNNRPSDFNYDQQQQQKMHQQHEEYHMQHQQQMPPYTYDEVSSDEGLTDCPGNVDCKCRTCSCRSSKNTCKGNGGRLRSPAAVGVGMVPRCDGTKKERFKQPYY